MTVSFVVSLDVGTRGTLERIIDKTINHIPHQVRLFRLKKTKLQIKDENEFVYGLAFGDIYGTFLLYFASIMERQPTDNELDEMIDIIDRRAREIRDAIFKAG